MPAGGAPGAVLVPRLLRRRPRRRRVRARPGGLRRRRRRRRRGRRPARGRRGVPVRPGRRLPGVAGVRGGRRVPGPVRRPAVRRAQGVHGARAPGPVRVQARAGRDRGRRADVRAGGPRVPDGRRLRPALAVHGPRPVPEPVRRRRPVPRRQDVPGARPPGRVRVRGQLHAVRVHVPAGRRLRGPRGVRRLRLRRPVRQRHVPGRRPVHSRGTPARVQVLPGRLQRRF